MNIVVIMGGASMERDVSISSGKAIYDTLVSLGHDVSMADPTLGDDQSNVAEIFESAEVNNTPPVLDMLDEEVKISALAMIDNPLIANTDLVFIALHGTGGEDGIIQGMLKAAGVTFTGSDVRASAIAMDKDIAKVLLRHDGIQTPDWKCDRGQDLIDPQFNFDFPVVVKPNNQGSTVGLSIIDNQADINEAIKLAGKFSEMVIIEKFIPGRELTVAVLENQALPIIEIVPSHEMYDYECKYISGMTDYICPAELPEEITRKVQKAALESFEIVGCRDYARVDFRLADDGIPQCLEVNTLPGMTATSLVPKAAKAIGISFEELIGKIVDLAAQRKI